MKVTNPKTSSFSILFLVLVISQSFAQTTEALRQEIQKIISDKKATVGLAIQGFDNKDTLTINGDLHLPLQSVFKYHIALKVLSLIDMRKLSMNQKIKIDKKNLMPNLWSPIRDKYPNGVTLKLSKIIKYTVAESDNVGCDILFNLIGGPKAVEDYLFKNKINDISIKLNEEQQQAKWEMQFQNWITPKAANKTLATFFYNKDKLLSKKSHQFIWKVMKQTETGQKRLKGQLPINALVAHKTGTSGTNKEGITAAVNDIGVVFLPNGQVYFISVFVANSTEKMETNEKMISEISKLTWDYFLAKIK